ncbi:leukotriene C4 synthase isoform X1 [Vulpes lagopus]|uniref:leukotriene C4 synthase isoform X1 n=1 Tax=Vulpes lagopus TaxID=494514 RepID=UPI001BCA4EF8|nr:leukotriene C4 synthase isoform X1 [Vulpes lagopus]
MGPRAALSHYPLSGNPSRTQLCPLQRHPLYAGITWSWTGLEPAPCPTYSRKVISARRAFRVSPPLTTGPPEFERVYRAQVNCSEHFPLFLATLWVAGIFFHEGTAALCGLVYLFARLRYFQGYARSAQQRLTPLYASARALWLLVALAALGLLVHFLPRALRAALLGRLGTLLPRA